MDTKLRPERTHAAPRDRRAAIAPVGDSRHGMAEPTKTACLPALTEQQIAMLGDVFAEAYRLMKLADTRGPKLENEK